MSSEMAQSIARQLPFLQALRARPDRRPASGDGLVRDSLERLLRDERLLDHEAIKLSLYRALSVIWADRAPPAPADDGLTIENAASSPRGSPGWATPGGRS